MAYIDYDTRDITFDSDVPKAYRVNLRGLFQLRSSMTCVAGNVSSDEL